MGHADPATAGSGLATGGAGRARYVNIAVKAAFAVLLVMVALGHDWPQLQGKAVGLRLVFYPLSALVVPVTWWLRGRRGRYLHDVDALLVAPFAIDLAGNLLNLFDSVSWWDDANHLVSPSAACPGWSAGGGARGWSRPAGPGPRRGRYVPGDPGLTATAHTSGRRRLPFC